MAVRQRPLVALTAIAAVLFTWFGAPGDAEARVVVAAKVETTPTSVQLVTTVDSARAVEWERVELAPTSAPVWLLVPSEATDTVAMTSDDLIATLDRLTAPALQRTLAPRCETETAWGTAAVPTARGLQGRALRLDAAEALTSFLAAERVAVGGTTLAALGGHFQQGGVVDAIEVRSPGTGPFAAAVRIVRGTRAAQVSLDWVFADVNAIPVTTFLLGTHPAEAGVVHTLDVAALAHGTSDLHADYTHLLAATLASLPDDSAVLESRTGPIASIATSSDDRDALTSAFGTGAPWITRLALQVRALGRGSLLVPRLRAGGDEKLAFSHEDGVCTDDKGAHASLPPAAAAPAYADPNYAPPQSPSSSQSTDDDVAGAEVAGACTAIAIESCSSAASAGDDDDSTDASDDSCSSSKKSEGPTENGDADSTSEESDEESLDLERTRGVHLSRHVVKKRSPVSRIAMGVFAVLLPLRRRRK